MNPASLPIQNTVSSKTFVPAAKQGSALLVTLLVSSLLLLLVMSFVIIIRMELRRVTAHQQQMLARANARLGGELAVAQLQGLMGPDTRASVPAVTAGGNSPHDSNRHWTAVIDTALHSRPPGEHPSVNTELGRVLGWLSSAPRPDVPTLDAQGNPLPGHALLLGAGSVSDPADRVAAPLVSLQNAQGAQTGAYAWWVADENRKTRVDLGDPWRLDGNASTDLWRAFTVQRTASETLFPGFDPDNPLHQSDFSKALTLAHIGLARLDSPADIQGHFHDFTLAAEGLAVNPIRGGLKRDLTAVALETMANGNRLAGGPQFNALLADQTERMQRMLEETQLLPASNPGLPQHLWNALNAIRLRAEQASPAYARLLFPPFSDVQLSRDPGGPSWEQLFSWVTLRERQQQGAAVRAARSTGELANPMPVIAKFNLGVYHTMDFPRVRLHLVPAVVLWNPYSVPLAAREYHAVLNISPESTHGGGFGMSFQVSHPDWQGGSRFWTPAYQMEFAVSGQPAFRFRLAPVEIPAGGAVIFTLPDHLEFRVVSNTSQAGYTFWQRQINQGNLGFVENKWIDLSPGLHGGGGYSFWVEEPDIRPKIIQSASTQESGYAEGHFNWWGHAGAPLYFSGSPGWTDAVTDAHGPALRDICFNETGMDLDRGWRIHRTAAIMIRGMGSPRRQLNLWTHTSLGNANLILGGEANQTDRNNTNADRRPWLYVHNVNQVVPRNLHAATPHFQPGVFPEIEGPPPSFDPSRPFRPNSPGFSPRFPLWGVSWGLRLPDNTYEFAAATAGSTRLNQQAPIAWLAHYNPAAAMQARSGLGREQAYDRGSFEFDAPANYIGGFTLDPNYFDLSPNTPDDLHAFIGHSDGMSAGLAPGEIPRAILFELPESVHELVSIASLSHANLQSDGLHTNGVDRGSRLTLNQFLNNAVQPARPIGNALMPPLLFSHQAVRSFFGTPHFTGDPEQPPRPIPYTDGHLTGTWFGGDGNDVFITFRATYDTSWVLNHLLWDDFLFSSDANSRIAWRQGTPERDFLLSADRMHLRGAFNVNSTSESAWRALLHSLLDVDLPNRQNLPEAVPGVERIPFARFLRPHSPAFSPAAGDRFDDPANYTGYRRLSPEEVDALAREIVREVRERGPFLSLGDFVNRRLLRPEQDPGGHRIRGALQAAIDRAGLNASQTHPADPTSQIRPADFSGTHTNGRPIFQGYDLAAASIPGNHGAPGFFTQADLLSRIGAVLTTRSDTFRIRAFGEGPGGARAYCEIVVRRSGRYLDPADASHLHPSAANPVNQRFGRRFEIVSFRWLSPEEV